MNPFVKIKNKLIRRFRFKTHSLKVKLIVIFIIISILPIVFAQIGLYEFTRFYIEKKITKLSDVNLTYIKKNIETDTNYYKDILYRIAADNNCLELETKFNNGNDLEKVTSRNEIRDAFSAYSYSRSQIKAITFVSKDGRNVYYDKENQGINNRVWDVYSDDAKEKIYSTISRSNTSVILSTTQNNYAGEKPEYMFHIGMKVINITTKESLGIIIMSFDEQTISDICNIEGENLSEDNTNMCSVIIDNNGKIVSFQNKKYIGTSIKEYSKGKKSDDENSETLVQFIDSTHLFTGNNIYISSEPINNTNWRVINIVDKDSLFYEIKLLRNLTFIFLIIIIIIVIISIFTFSNKFYDSVKKIVEGMNEMKKGNFDVRIKLDTEDELAFIGDEFNKMSSKINNLVDGIKKQGEYILEISNKKKEAEVKAIVGQINPHFLYNTLDCINWMAIEKEQYDISDMLGNLAQILRYSIGDINKEVSVYDETEWLKKYIYLQKVRFNNSFDFKLDVDERVLGHRIHKLLLQPLIENSLIHGFKGVDSGGELKVNIRELQKKYIILTVEDNGNGIAKDKLKDILNYIRLDNNSDGNKNVGIKNVYDRIKIYYGDLGKLYIESLEGKGTKITMIIPIGGDL